MTGKRRKGKDPVNPPAPPDPPRSEEPPPEPPAAERPPPEPPVAEPPRWGDSQPEPPRSDEPQTEPPRSDEPQTELPHWEDPSPEAPRVESPRSEDRPAVPPSPEQPVTEPPIAEPPIDEPPRWGDPQPEAPRSEDPQPEPPRSDEPQTELPHWEDPIPERPSFEPSEPIRADHTEHDGSEVDTDGPATRASEPTAAPPMASVVAPRVSRRQARLARKRQQRRRVGLLGGSLIAIVVIVVAALAAVGVHHVVTKDSGPSRDQTTVLLQVQAPNRTAMASALLAENPSDHNGVEVLLPSHVITEVCGYNTVNFGDVLALPDGETASREAVSGMLGHISVNGSWVLQPAQLSKLIGLLGGITIDVDVNVVRHSSGGGSQILVPAGSNRRLTGDQAVEYATYSTSRQEDASAQLARLQQVIDATVQKLPSSSTGVAALVRQLGPGGGSTLGVDRLSTMLLGFATAERGTGRLLPIDLPVNSVETGGAPSYRVDTEGAERLANTSLADSLPADAGAPRPTVELLNGVGEPGLVATACPRLAAGHLAYAGSGNATSFHNPTSTVAVSTSNVDLGYQVARALRLPRSDVRRTSQDQSVADAIVTLGNDYKP
jgi:hypothetical protein